MQQTIQKTEAQQVPTVQQLPLTDEHQIFTERVYRVTLKPNQLHPISREVIPNMQSYG